MNYFQIIKQLKESQDRERKDTATIYKLSIALGRAEALIDSLKEKLEELKFKGCEEDDEPEVEWEEDEEENPPLTADEKIDIHKIIKETENGK